MRNDRYYVVVVVLTLTRIIKSVVTRQAPVTLELRNTPGKTHTTQGGTRVYIRGSLSWVASGLVGFSRRE